LSHKMTNVPLDARRGKPHLRLEPFRKDYALHDFPMS
jgi:hypothetical protein